MVHEIHAEPKGAFFTATHRHWLKGMLTTDVQFGNDGALYVLDWVESWGGVGKGRIYKFTDPANANTALQKETEKLIFDGMTKLIWPLASAGKLTTGCAFTAPDSASSKGRHAIEILIWN